MSTRSAEYCELIEDVVANAHLLEPDERMELLDMINRIERRMLANMPAEEAAE